MNNSIKITSSLLAKNIVLNSIGQVVPLIVAVVAIPYVIHGLGAECFGILSIAWVVIGYFGMFDLGLGRSTTKFIAEALGKGTTEEIPRILWTSLFVQFFLGVLGSIILVAITPTLVLRVLNIPTEFIEEAKNTFYVLSFSIPVVICSITMRGVLEAAQRFDLVNAVKIPSNCLNFLLPAVGLLCGLRLPGIVILLLISRACTIGIYLIICFWIYPNIRVSLLIDTKFIRPLFSFGGWITVCVVLGQILGYLDRLFIGAFCTIADVGYYSTSSDMFLHLGFLPLVFGVTLFPAFCTLESDKNRLNVLYVRSLKYLLLIMGPIILVLFIFAGDILHLWLGGEWASKTTLVFQILAIGVLLNSLTHMPGHLLDGIGRPDLRAKLFLIYIFPYAALLWFLISKFGIVGAALAWTFRACLEFSLFFCVTWKVIRLNRTIFVENGIIRGAMVYGGLVITTLLLIVIPNKTLFVQGIITATGFILFAWIAWQYVLDMEDKQPLFLMIERVKGLRYRLNGLSK